MGEQHLRSTGLRFRVARRILSCTAYPRSDASGDEGAESTEPVEDTDDIEEIGLWLELLSDVELAPEESTS